MSGQVLLFAALSIAAIALAVVLALIRRAKGLNVRTMLTLHKVVGFCALLSGLIHATIIVIAT